MDTDINLPDASPTTTSGAGSLPHNDDVSLNSSESTLGRHLARRLVQIGVSDVFSVPDYFNITLLDHLMAEPGLNLVGCCDDLNAGYAADGYARSRGIGACVVTFDIRGLGVLNAIACAYSENLPLICIVGGPDSIASGSNLHHSIAVPDFDKELLCFQTVTCYQAVVNNLEDAHELIDTAISTALKQSKPVYISISCNLPAIPHPSFSREQVPLCLSSELSNQIGLEAAVEAAAQFLNKAVKPIMVGGPKLRVAKACGAFVELADSSGYALSLLPSAKGMVPEHHPHFVGIYEGPLSTAFCEKIVESADAYLFVGLMFDDHTSVDYLHLLNEKAISVHPDQVVIGNGPSFSYFLMKDFLKALAKRLKQNKTAYENYHRISVPEEHPLKSPPKEPLRVNVLFEHIQKMLSGNTAVIADTWNTWYNCQKLKLPDGCGYESQMQYQSIGWSVGATLGYAQAATNKRVIACIGDGSFQVTALDVSTMISYGQKSIIFLINKGGYTVYNKMKYWNNPALLDAIPKGEGKCWTSYNVIKNWNYSALVGSIHNGEGKCWTAKVFCEEELIEAIKTATGKKKDSLCFIEVILHKYDSKELLELGHMAPYLLYSD